MTSTLDTTTGVTRAVSVPDLTPGTPEWLQLMTASKVAAVLGLSPFESRYSLWQRMAGHLPPVPESTVMRRGHYLEPAVRAWYADQHPDLAITETGTWRSLDDPRFAATPDGLAHGDAPAPILLEFKTASDDSQWGKAGTDEIPPAYRVQVMWGLHVLGLRTAHVAVLTAFLEFREYVISYDDFEAGLLVDAVTEFLDSITTGTAPDLDGHDETYRAVRALHPDIDDTAVELPADVAVAYAEAVAAIEAAEAAKTAASAAVIDAMGSARRATYGGAPVAMRVPGRGDAAPYLTKSRGKKAHA
jgi:putative phage-type endonuclease